MEYSSSSLIDPGDPGVMYQEIFLTTIFPGNPFICASTCPLVAIRCCRTEIVENPYLD